MKAESASSTWKVGEVNECLFVPKFPSTHRPPARKVALVLFIYRVNWQNSHELAGTKSGIWLAHINLNEYISTISSLYQTHKVSD